MTQKPTISSLSSNSNSGTPFSSLTLPEVQPQSTMPEIKVDQCEGGGMDVGVDCVDTGEMTTSLVTQVMVTPGAPESPKGKGLTPQKRSRKVDISKFNRSNRKSKNCAIFYFRHLDTDGEQKGFSSQGSEAFKSSEPSTDEEWYYTNNGGGGEEENNEASNGNHHDDHDDEEPPNHTLVSSAVDTVIPSTAETVEAKQDCLTTSPGAESTTKRAIKVRVWEGD